MKAPALLFVIAAAASMAAPVQASDVRFNVGINFPSVPVQVASYSPPRVIIDEPMEFIPLPGLGFSAAVGTPYDVFNIGTNYYLNRGGTWYRSGNYMGDWVTVSYSTIPWQLRRNPVERIRTIREVEYRRHGRDPEYFYAAHHGGDYRHDNRRWDNRHDNNRWADTRRWDNRGEHGERYWKHERDDN